MQCYNICILNVMSSSVLDKYWCCSPNFKLDHSWLGESRLGLPRGLDPLLDALEEFLLEFLLDALDELTLHH